MTGEQILEYFITAPMDEAQKLCHQIEAVMMVRLRLAGDCAPSRGRPRGSRNKLKDDGRAPLIVEHPDGHRVEILPTGGT